MHLGQTIGRLRSKKGLTQTAFAEPYMNQVAGDALGTERRSATLQDSGENGRGSRHFTAGTDGRRPYRSHFTLNQLHDEELTTLLSRVHKLNAQEINALKVFLGALLTRVEMEEMLSRRKSA